MHKRRQSKIDSLVRMRRMSEQCEELALEKTAGAVRDAEIELCQANTRLSSATEWKSGLERESNGWLGLYEQALLAEGNLLVEAESADVSARDANAEHSAQAARLLQANRGLEVAQRRSDRCRHEAGQMFERKMADEVADMWLSRRLNADS